MRRAPSGAPPSISISISIPLSITDVDTDVDAALQQHGGAPRVDLGRDPLGARVRVGAGIGVGVGVSDGVSSIGMGG